MPFTFDPLWRQSLQAPASGLGLARENGRLLAWDANGWLYLFNHAGRGQGQVRFTEPILEACIADDGSAILVSGKAGLVRLLAQDFTVRWETRLRRGLVAAALEPLAYTLIVSDDQGGITLFRGDGQK